MLRHCTAVLTLALFSMPVSAQHITGSITGTVLDPSGLALAGANVMLVNAGTTAQLAAATNEQGVFEFLSLVPGAYNLSVEASGFKKLLKAGLELSANQRLSTGPLALEIGSVAESVTVSGRVEAVQTASAERSGAVTRLLIENLQSMSRDPLELVAMLPGFVVDGAGYGPIHAPHSMREISVNGSRRNNKNFTVDGITAMNTVTNQAASVTPNMDAVEEVQVQLANYQAEYGRSAGPAINIISRSGSQTFHGSAYFYIRNEALNAASFFDNKDRRPKPRYRYRTEGFTIGGPVYIPRAFNTDRRKLFFFFSESRQPASLPAPLHQMTMPTELERRGDFSSTVNQQGQRLVVRDPVTRQPFDNNRIPAAMLNPLGVELLNIFPLPNASDPTRRFNYQQSGIPYQTPRSEEAVKIDYNHSGRYTFYGRYIQDSNDIITDYISNYSATGTRLSRPGKNFSFRSTQTFSPRLVNEATFGYNHLNNTTGPENAAAIARIQRSQLGVKLGQFNKGNNPEDAIPNLSFGPVFSGDLAPSINQVFNGQKIRGFSFVDNLSRIHGNHILKFGGYWERVRTDDLPQGAFAGALDFSVSDANNPNNSGHPYANAVLGNFTTYREVSLRRVTPFRFTNIEWYAQDNWRVTRKLTLDYGLRFYWHPPESADTRSMSGFDLARFDAARRVRLYEPFRNAQGQIVARDPATLAEVSRTLIGAIVPGSGDVGNGIVSASGQNVPQGLVNSQGVLLAPRIGFAFDPTGKGSTAIRGGFGMFYDRLAGAIIQPYVTNPPAVLTPTIYYGNLSTFLNTSGVLFPQTVTGMARSGEIPTTMNFSFGVQRRLGNLATVEVTYVGSLARHLAEERDYNSTAFGANFRRESEDPTNPGFALRPTFLRPYRGYDAIRILEFSSNASYHSLQTRLSRRFGRRFNFDGNWTWSKAMIYADGDRSLRSFLLPGWRDYGKAGLDATHVVNINYIYEIPALGPRLGGHAVLRQIFDGWRLSGITRFVSGFPSAVTFQPPAGWDTTGSTEGGRINVIANPVLPKSERTFSRHFNTAAFALPRRGQLGSTGPVDFGNAPRDVYRTPGINNWSMSLAKDFPIHERHRLVFGAEFFNAFNHTQFRRADSVARYNAQGQQTNPRFGEYMSGYEPRVIQFSLRYSF